LKHYYPHHKILERAALWGKIGIDRVLKTQNEIIAVELKSGTTNSTSWREEKTLHAILLRLSQIKEEYGKYPPYSLLLTSAKVGRDVRIIRWVTGQHRKHYISSSPFPFQKSRIENGVWSLKIPYRPPEEKMVPDHGWREKCKLHFLRNRLWVEVRVIGEEKICSVLQGNQDALELLWILQKPFSLLHIPKDINKEISEWRNKLT